MLPRHQVRQQRPAEVSTLTSRKERSLPVSRAVLPYNCRKTGDGIEGSKFFIVRPFDSGITNHGGCILLCLLCAYSHGDSHGRLDGEDIIALVCAASLAAEVEYPDFVAVPAQMLAHTAEGDAIEIARCTDETDHARPVSRRMLKNLPQCPAPEIDIQVVEVLNVAAMPGGDNRGEKIVKNCLPTVVAPANPTARAGLVVRGGGLMPVVGRITEADDDRHGAFDCKRPGVLVCDRTQEKRQLRRFGVWAFERIGQVNMRAVRGQLCTVVAQGTADAQFRHRVSADHQLEAVQVLSQCGSLARHSASALRSFNAAQGVIDDAEQIRSGADGRIKSDDAGISETQGFPKTVNEQIIDQAHLDTHHLDRGVVDASVFT